MKQKGTDMFKICKNRAAWAAPVELTRANTFEEAWDLVTTKYTVIHGEKDEEHEGCADFYVKLPEGGTAILTIEPVDFKIEK